MKIFLIIAVIAVTVVICAIAINFYISKEDTNSESGIMVKRIELYDNKKTVQ